MEITYKVALEVATHEALVRQAYRNPGDVWTWSIGLTNATGHDVTRYVDNPQPIEHCLAIYVWALNNYAEGVRAEFAGYNLTEGQFAAALSFHWNTGAIQSATWPDLWKAGRIEEARESMMQWRKPPSIIPRRKQEAALFFDGVWSQTGKILEYTRLKSSHAVDWGSAVKTDISEPLGALLGTPAEPVAPEPGQDDAVALLRDIRAQIDAFLGGA